MSKRRYVDTKFWSDDYILELDSDEKLLFMYLLTNEKTNIAGVYELPIQYVTFETDIDAETVKNVLTKFEEDGKVYHIYGYVYIHNFLKHQNMKSQKVRKGVKRILANTPDKVKKRVAEIELEAIGYQGVSEGYRYVSNYLNLDLYLDSNLDSIKEVDSKESESEESEVVSDHDKIVTVMDAFRDWNPAAKRWYGNKTQRQAAGDLIEAYGLDEVIKVIGILPKTNEMEYLPKITTPHQLLDGYESLRSGLKRKEKKQLSDSESNIAFTS